MIRQALKFVLFALFFNFTIASGQSKREIKEMFYEAESWMLFEDYKEELKSKRADIKNAGYGRSGGSIMAALFLGEFIELERWVHLDIAGPAMLSKPFYYMPEGGTGFGVRLLIQYLRGEK